MPDRPAGLPLGDGEIELRLKIDPELRLGAEPVPEPQRGIAGDGALAGDDLADAVRRHGDLARELRRRHLQPGQFVLQNFARMDGSPEQGHFPVP